MTTLFSLLLLLACALAAAAAQLSIPTASAPAALPQWIGMTAAENEPQSVSIFGLDNKSGNRTATLFKLQLPSAEHLTPDAFRCMPYGTFCLLLATTGQPGTQPAEAGTTLYNISLTAGNAYTAAALPGMAYNLHVHHTTGFAYTVLISQGQAVVVCVSGSQFTPLVDLTAFVADETRINPGGTTQCSNVNYMWIALEQARMPGVANLTNMMAVVDLNALRLVSTFAINGSLPVALWDACGGPSNDPPGGTMPLGNGAVGFGTFDSKGNFEVTAQGRLPQSDAPLKPTALLSQPVISDYFFAVYPGDVVPGGPAVSGYLAFGSYKKPNITFTPIDYYLTGAARVS